MSPKTPVSDSHGRQHLIVCQWSVLIIYIQYRGGWTEVDRYLSPTDTRPKNISVKLDRANF